MLISHPKAGACKIVTPKWMRGQQFDSSALGKDIFAFGIPSPDSNAVLQVADGHLELHTEPDSTEARCPLFKTTPQIYPFLHFSWANFPCLAGSPGFLPWDLPQAVAK